MRAQRVVSRCCTLGLTNEFLVAALEHFDACFLANGDLSGCLSFGPKAFFCLDPLRPQRLQRFLGPGAGLPLLVDVEERPAFRRIRARVGRFDRLTRLGEVSAEPVLQPP